MRGGLLSVARGGKQERCMAHLVYDSSAVVTLALCHCLYREAQRQKSVRKYKIGFAISH